MAGTQARSSEITLNKGTRKLEINWPTCAKLSNPATDVPCMNTEYVNSKILSSLGTEFIKSYQSCNSTPTNLIRHIQDSMPSKVCQMFSWWMKNGPHFINIRETVTNAVPLHSVN